MTQFNSSNRLDELFRNNLKNYRQEPPKKSWSRLREEINARNRAPWSTYAEGFVLICIAAAGLFAFYNYSPSDKNTGNQNTENIFTVSPFAAPQSKKDIARMNAAAKAKKSSRTASLQQKKNKSLALQAASVQVPLESTPIISENLVSNPIPVSKSESQASPNTIINQTSTATVAKTTKTIGFTEAAQVTEKTPPATELLTSMELKALMIDKAKQDVQDLNYMGKEDQDGFSRQMPGRKQLPRNAFYLGMSYAMNNTWIFNQNTYGEFGGSELNYKVDFGSAYGLQAGFEFKDKFGVQFECNLRSLQGQKYEDQLYLGHVKREVSLHYSSFPLIFKKIQQVSHVNNTKIRLNYLAGLQYNVLRSAVITVNDNQINAMDRFNKHDVAILLGAEANVFVMNNLFVTVGVRGSISSNINDKNYDIVNNKNGFISNYKNSHNTLLGANVGLNYCFGK